MTDNQNVEISCEIIVVKGQAVLINDGTKNVWIPLSQISDISGDLTDGNHIEIIIPEWLALKEGLI